MATRTMSIGSLQLSRHGSRPQPVAEGDSSNLPGLQSEAASDISRDAPVTADSDKQQDSAESESIDARIERLGRDRPEKFKSIWAELGFCFSICMSQILAVSTY